MNSLVSIIMPAFNSAYFIRESINSVLNQTYKNFELIIIDDCSSDDTIRIITSIKDDRIILLTNSENRGAAYCRNLGIAKSKGEFIAFLDADDLWVPTKLEKQLNFMKNNHYDFTYSFFTEINEHGVQTGIIHRGPRKITHRSFLRANYVGCLTIVYKKSICEKLSIPESIKKRNDYALWLKVSEVTPCYCFPEILACYRRRDNSISSTKLSELFKHHIKLFEDLYLLSPCKSRLYAIRNVFYYFYRRLFYIRKK